MRIYKETAKLNSKNGKNICFTDEKVWKGLTPRGFLDSFRYANKPFWGIMQFFEKKSNNFAAEFLPSS